MKVTMIEHQWCPDALQHCVVKDVLSQKVWYRGDTGRWRSGAIDRIGPGVLRIKDRQGCVVTKKVEEVYTRERA